MTTNRFVKDVILEKDKQIQQAVDIAISFLEIKKKTKYNITRDDGWRIAFQKIRKGPLKKHPITDEDMKNVKKLLESNKTHQEIAKSLGLTTRRVSNIIQKTNHYEWVPDKKFVTKHTAQVIKLRKNGYSYQQIRDKLHISGGIITVILKKHKMLGERHTRGIKN